MIFEQHELDWAARTSRANVAEVETGTHQTINSKWFAIVAGSAAI
jgi:hypothetical protein